MTLKKDTDNVARADLEELGTNKGSEIGGKGDSRIYLQGRYNIAGGICSQLQVEVEWWWRLMLTAYSFQRLLHLVQ